MLVLSRRPTQEVLFPNSGIRVRILAVGGGVARVGIEAPPHVPIFRGEIAQEAGVQCHSTASAQRHALRNELNKVGLALYRFQQLWQAGAHDQANEALEAGLSALESIDRDWLKPAPPPACYRALLVEDDANERELLAGILGMNGCQCETAEDGQGALEYLSSHAPPDLVLLDMGLPRLSGPQALALIRRDPRYHGLRVFAVSGSAPEELGVAVGCGGVDAWFRKPLSPRRLWDAIRQELTCRHSATPGQQAS